MGWWGRGGEPAQPSRAMGCPGSQPPSHSSPQPPDTSGVLLSPTLSPAPGVTGLEGHSRVVLEQWAAASQGTGE